ncbi:MAG: hypothetical protein WEC81_02055 [Patescibacteria group bacterium]
MKLIGFLVLVVGFGLGLVKIYFGLTDNNAVQAVQGLLTMLGTLCLWCGVVILFLNSSKNEPRTGERVQVVEVIVGGLLSPHKAMMVADSKRQYEDMFRVYYAPLKDLPNGNQTLKGQRLLYSMDNKWYEDPSPAE